MVRLNNNTMLFSFFDFKDNLSRESLQTQPIYLMANYLEAERLLNGRGEI